MNPDILIAQIAHLAAENAGLRDDLCEIRKAAVLVIYECGPHSTPSNGVIERLAALLPGWNDEKGWGSA